MIQSPNVSQGFEKVSCELYPECGGCQTLHLDYSIQLEQKQNRLQELFEPWRSVLAQIVPSPQITEYRNKVLMPVTPKWPTKAGLFKRGTHKVIPTKNCPVSAPHLMTLAQKTMKVINKHRIPGYSEHNYKGVLRYILLRYCPKTQQSLLALIIRNPVRSEAVFNHLWETLEPLGTVSLFANINTKRNNVILSSDSQLMKGTSYYESKLLNRTFYVGAQSFYQTNTAQAELIYQEIARYAQFHQGTIWDLYCGVGTIAQLISDKYPVVGVESTAEAVALGKQALKQNQLSNVTLINQDIDVFLQKPLLQPKLVVVNPPRTGLSSKLIEALNRIRPEAILYLSCNPKSFKKNVLDLTPYQVKSIQPYDMFPHTSHIEVLGYLCRQ